MLDYQRIADDVRNSLSVQGMEDADYLRAIVADFAVACEEVNERLQQCEALLRRGLRSEALHLCEIEPNLLDAVAALDVPERQQWEEFVGQFGLVPPIPVNVAAAEALNDAYAAEQPMAKLLRNHRLLALARGPLSDRIGVLRRLAEADPANPLWAEDLEAFERVRLDQIRDEAIAAGAQGDLDALERLCEEVCCPSWRTPPPGRLIDSVVKIRNKLAHVELHRALEAIAYALNDAFGAFDVNWGRQLRAQWNELLVTPGFAPSAELSNRAAPALEWLDQQDRIEEQQQRHDAAVAALQQALDGNKSLPKLQQLYQRATRDAEALPPELEQRYRTRVESLRRAATRRRYLAVGASVALVVLLAGVVYRAIDRQATHSRLEQVRQNLEDMLDRGDLDAADNYRKPIEREEPETLKEPAIAVLIARLDSALAEEEQRRERFGSTVARVDELLGAAQDSTGKATTWPHFTECRALFVELEDALEEAVATSRTDEDQTRIATLRRRMEDSRKQLRGKELAKLAEQFDSLDDDIRRLETVPDRAKSETAQQTLRTLGEKVRELDVPGLYRARIEQHGNRLDKLRELQAVLQREAPYLEAVSRAVGDPDAYQGALNAYARQFQTPRAADFGRVAAGKAVWDAVLQFNTFMERWSREVPARLDPNMAKEYLTTVHSFHEGRHGVFRDPSIAGAVQQRVPLLQAIANRGSGDARDALQRELDRPIMRTCWIVTDRTSGKRYYILEEPNLRPGRNNMPFVINRDGQQRGTLIEGDQADVAVAPQVPLSNDIRSVLAKLDHQNWEAQLYGIMEAIYRAKEVDEVLRFDLLRMALGTARESSYPMAEAFAKHDEAFRQSKVNLDASWMDPDCPKADEARKLARAELQQLPSFINAWKQAQERLAALCQPPARPLHWAGWLRKNVQNRWEPVVSANLSGHGDVLVFCTEGNNLQRLIIGTVQGGNIVLDAPATVTLREGMPLFVVSTAPR